MSEIHPIDQRRVREWVNENKSHFLTGDVAVAVQALLADYEQRHKPQGGEGLELEFQTPRLVRYVLWDTVAGLDLDLLHPTIEAARAHALELDAPGEEQQMGILKIDCDLKYVADVLPLEVAEPVPALPAQRDLFSTEQP